MDATWTKALAQQISCLRAAKTQHHRQVGALGLLDQFMQFLAAVDSCQGNSQCGSKDKKGYITRFKDSKVASCSMVLPTNGPPKVRPNCLTKCSFTIPQHTLHHSKTWKVCRTADFFLYKEVLRGGCGVLYRLENTVRGSKQMPFPTHFTNPRPQTYINNSYESCNYGANHAQVSTSDQKEIKKRTVGRLVEGVILNSTSVLISILSTDSAHFSFH
eukprot:1139803-Pelagomonas_calceolata.AAC.4